MVGLAILKHSYDLRGHKVYSLHAPEVECIGKGKAHRPYEFGVKESVATTVKHSAGGQFVSHVAWLSGNPYDGRTLASVIPQMQALIGNVLDRRITDAGYRCHNAPPEHKFKVYTSGQRRRLTPQIKREFKRRAAIEPVIGYYKEHHRMGPKSPCRRSAYLPSPNSSEMWGATKIHGELLKLGIAVAQSTVIASSAAATISGK